MRAEYPRDLDVSSDVSIDIFLIIDPTRNKSILSEHESSKAKVPRLSSKYGPLG